MNRRDFLRKTTEVIAGTAAMPVIVESALMDLSKKRRLIDQYCNSCRDKLFCDKYSHATGDGPLFDCACGGPFSHNDWHFVH